MLKPPRVPLPNVKATAYDRIAFLADHFPQLVEMYQTIMEHLKIPGGEVSGGDCKWVDGIPDTFIPMYIKFTKESPVAITPEIAKGMDLDGAPLYYVGEDTDYISYAAPIPFIQKEHNDLYPFLPEVMHLNYMGFIATIPTEARLFIPKGSFEIMPGHAMSLIPNVYVLGCGTACNFDSVPSFEDSLSSLGLTEIEDEFEPYYYSIGYSEYDSPFWVQELAQDFTPFTFNTIKPEDNKHIYLGE